MGYEWQLRGCHWKKDEITNEIEKGCLATGHQQSFQTNFAY
jgi:hypothetical protein